jgi:hypothetical protein
MKPATPPSSPALRVTTHLLTGKSKLEKQGFGRRKENKVIAFPSQLPRDIKLVGSQELRCLPHNYWFLSSPPSFLPQMTQEAYSFIFARALLCELNGGRIRRLWPS